MTDTTVLIVEPHDTLREATTAFVRISFPKASVLAVNGLRHALEIVGAEAVDAVLMDVWSPPMPGLEAIRAIRDRAPMTAIVVYSMYDEKPCADVALAAGASAFVAKSRTAQDLIPVLRKVLALRERIVSKSMARDSGKGTMRGRA